MLDQTPFGLMLKKDRSGNRTPNYNQQGTMKLFFVLKRFCRRRHRSLSALALLPGITPVSSHVWLGHSRDRPFHLIMESDGTFNHPVVLRGLKRPQFHFPFISTFSFWQYLIALEFRNLAAQRLCNGVFGTIGKWLGATSRSGSLYQKSQQIFAWVTMFRHILVKVVRYSGYLMRRNLIAQNSFSC
ncbi:MAG: hypothetical protein ABIU05_03990 [Nitrospirales bacterium]